VTVDPILAAGLGCVFFAVVLAVATVTFGRRERKAVGRSLEALAAFRASPRVLRDHELDQPFSERVLGPLSRRFISAGRWATPDDRLDRIRRRLDLAGNPPGWDVDRILGLKALGLLVGVFLGAVVPPVFGAGLRWTLIILLVLAVLGWFGPTMWIYQVGYDRTERLRAELPDAIDLLTISVEAGLAFDAALAQVARNTEGPLGQEFFRVLQEMQIGTGRIDALRALSERTDLEELRVFVGAMVQAEGFGIPIANVLRVQSREMRVKRRQRAEEKAQKVPVKILFPLIFCIMPALFIVVLGPAAIQMFQQFRGL
jgi:tight adherence protein C